MASAVLHLKMCILKFVNSLSENFIDIFCSFFVTAEKILAIVTNPVKTVGFRKTLSLPELVSVSYINCYLGHYHFEYNSLYPTRGTVEHFVNED